MTLRRLASLSILLATASLMGCSAEVARRSGGSGSGSSRDTGTSQDTGTLEDTATADTDPADTGSPDTDPADTGTSGDTTPVDTGTNDTTPVDTGSTDTGSTASCSTTAECVSRFGATFACVGGQCVEQSGTAPCAVDGQLCTDPATQETDTFLCVTDATGTGAVCRQFCDATTADETASADCPANSYCLDVGGSSPTGLTGACLPGDCTTNIFDNAACGGTGTCLPVGNGASFCISAGTANVGAPCNLDTSASPPASDSCARGLLCSANTCIEPCNRANGNADCAGGDACLGAFENTPRNRPGLCGQGCAAFSTGDCGAGQSCQALIGRSGVNVWACIDENAGPTYALGEVCDPTANCAEGSICIPDEVDALGNPVNHCVQLCNPADELTGVGTCAGLANPEVCAPSRVTGLGLCSESCQPFPRSNGSNYGCSGADDSCLPFVLTNNRATDPRGTCEANSGTGRPFSACATSGTFGDCVDFGLCYDTTDDSVDNATCAPLCPPLDQTNICGSGATCSAVLPLVGNLAFSVCTRTFTAGTLGARCVDEGLPCAAAGTVCIDTGTGATCTLACREGYNDCAADAGTTCNTGVLNPDVVPAFMGLCL